MGAGGVIVPPATYFDKIQPILKKYDILFVADEVICGFGRTGNMFATETYNLQPDIITVAKALSSAYLPISGLMINEKVSDAIYKNSGEIGTFGHGFTYSGHPVACAVALETLNIYEERNIVGHDHIEDREAGHLEDQRNKAGEPAERAGELFDARRLRGGEQIARKREAGPEQHRR